MDIWSHESYESYGCIKFPCNIFEDLFFTNKQYTKIRYLDFDLKSIYLWLQRVCGSCSFCIATDLRP